MSDLVLNMGIDTSGQPYESIFVGLVSIKIDNIKKVERSFKKNFSRSFSGKHKGSKLKEQDLKNIVDFFQNNGVFMSAIEFSSTEWPIIKNQFKNKAYLVERIYSLLYFKIIKNYSYKFTKNSYIISLCNENNIDIEKVVGYLNYLLKANNINAVLNIGYSKTNTLIKFADYVAAALRKVDKNYLDNKDLYLRHKYRDIHYKYIHKIFKK